MPVAYIALGSNLGDREGNIRRAVEFLGKVKQARLGKVSRLRETVPVGGPPQGKYLNAVAALDILQETSQGDVLYSPRWLLNILQGIENAGGRARTERWGPRTIDLDLLAYGGMIMNEPDLVVPHPRLSERRFVLEPLVEIAPEWAHPVLKKTAAELLAALDRFANA